MSPRTIFEQHELDAPVSSEQPGLRRVLDKALAMIARYRLVLGSFGITIVLVVVVIAWRSTVRGASTPVAPSPGMKVVSGSERPLEITVLSVHDVHDAVAAAPAAPRVTAAPATPRVATAPPPPRVTSAPPPPTVAATRPAAASTPASSLRATGSSSSRSTVAPRSAPARAQVESTANASTRPVAAARSVPAEEPRVENAPARPQPRPDGPLLESNPYVYK